MTVRLLCWKPELAQERARLLQDAGLTVDASPLNPSGLIGQFRVAMPSAVVIDLDRLPSSGMGVAAMLRGSKSTRHIPIVFAGGLEEKVARARQELPDAVFTDWKHAAGAVRKALKNAPVEPVQPMAHMERYAGSPLFKKLGFAPKMRVALLGAPDDFVDKLGDLPEGLELLRKMTAQTKLALWFVRSRRELEMETEFVSARLPNGASIWIIHPKQAGRFRVDFNQNDVRAAGLAAGLVDYKVCAVDEDWSGLKFARKKISRRPLLALLASAWVLRAETARLEIAISTGGAPTAARVYITGPEGKAITIPGAVSYTRRDESHSIVDRSVVVHLPPGRYTVRAEKGAEFRAFEKVVDVSGMARIELDVPRFCDMNAKGWYSGDLHIHRNPDEIPLLARAEELNIAPVITRHVGNTREVKAAFPAKHLVPVDATHIVSLQNQEVERLFTGHGAVVLLNTPQPVEANPGILFPLDVEFCRAARRQSGFVDGEKPIWKNVPVNVAFGVLDAIGVVNNHFHPHDVMLDAEKWGSMDRGSAAYATVEGFAHWMLDLYYSFLNCGFRIPVSAGSASGVMSSWPGYERVYVHLSGPFSYEQWFRDLKVGRSVATNGPLMRVLVDGRPPGAEFAFRKGMRVGLSVDVDSVVPLKSVEVVFNGQVLRTASAGARVELPIDAPGWLAVRCFEPAGVTLRYAHSSPFYFVRDGKLPVRRADAVRWAEYIRELAGGVRAPDYASEKQYLIAQDTFQKAEMVYRRLAL